MRVSVKELNKRAMKDMQDRLMQTLQRKNMD
jgi:hypothetical protein